MPGIKTIRVVAFQVSTSATTTSDPIDLDYRFDGSPTRTFFVQKSSAIGPSIFIQAAPYEDGPWITFAEVTAACTTTMIEKIFDVPYVRTAYAGAGPLVTIYGVV